MNHDLTVGRPGRVIFSFCLPLFLSVVFQQLYNIADSFVAGRFIGEEALAAVGNSYEMTLIFIAFVSQGIRHAPFHTFLVGGISHKGYTATHTFSCVFLKKKNISLYLSFTLQFRVSTCQRSLYTLKTDVRSTGSLRGCLTNLRLSLSSLILVFSFFLFPPGITCGFGRVRANAPERRCSSRTFRYGYLVTT